MIFSLIFALSVVSGTFPLTLRGKVTDKSTGKAIENANISIVGTTIGSATDKSGIFELSYLPSTPCDLQISAIGYQTIKIYYQPLISKSDLSIQLEPTIIQFPSVEIYGERYQYPTFQITHGYGSKMVTLSQIINSTGAMGDVIRYLTKLPNVQQRTDLNSLLYIRGGSPDQNLVLIDDIPIYNPYAMRLSMGGAVSLINSDLLQDAVLMDDGFGVRYGNRLSSVLNVKYREGNNEHFVWNSDLNLILGKFSIEGPVAGKGSYLVSFGQTYLDHLLNFFTTPKYNMIVPTHFLGLGPENVAPSGAVANEVFLLYSYAKLEPTTSPL